LQSDWIFIANTEKAAMMKNTDSEPVQCSFGIFYLNFPAEKTWFPSKNAQIRDGWLGASEYDIWPLRSNP